MMAASKNSYTFKLSEPQQDMLAGLMGSGTYLPIEVPHTKIAVDADHCKVMLYNSGKCLVQGKGATDFVQFVLEPLVLQEVVTGYEDVLHQEYFQPHIGVDESGKGDFFGPLVIAAVYTDEALSREFQSMSVKDSKTITSDKKALGMARALREKLGKRFALVTIGPRAYNRLYGSMRNVNAMLAWAHARAIENLLEVVPDCPRAVADQFGPKRQIERALMKKGRSITLEQRPRAESDPAVAAASVLARAGFLQALGKLEETYGVPIPKGASAKVVETAESLVRQRGPQVLLDLAKCHFRTADKVLAGAGFDRESLGAEGQAVSRQREPPGAPP